MNKYYIQGGYKSMKSYWYQCQSEAMEENFHDYTELKKERQREHSLRKRLSINIEEAEYSNNVDMDELRLAMIGGMES